MRSKFGLQTLTSFAFISFLSMLLTLLLTLLLSSCAVIDDARNSGDDWIPAAPTPTFTFNSLSGRVGQDNRVLAVKIDDTEQARPQIGITEADVVYVEQVEGGVTRLAAIYSSRIPARIGPVRSARISDIDLLEQYGKVAFAFSGAQRKLRPVIDGANLFNVGAEREGILVYSRDKDRRAPWNMILNTRELFSRIDKRELDVALATNRGWNFSEKNDSGAEIISAQMRWPATRYEIAWSKEYSGWLITHDGSSKEDARGVPIVASTFVAQVVPITDSEYGDKFGGRTPLVNTVGQGRVFIFRNGRVIAGTWNRPTAQDGTSFTDDDGNEITFARGQIWFALVAQEPEITLPAPPEAAQSALPSPSK